MEIASPITDCATGNHERHHQNRAEQKARIDKRRFDARQHGRSKQQKWRGEIRWAALQAIAEEARGNRRAGKERHEQRTKNKSRQIRTARVGEAEPGCHHDECGKRAGHVQQRTPAGNGNDEKAGDDEQEETKQEPGAVAVRRNGAEIDGKQERHGGSAECRVLECGIGGVGFLRRLPSARDSESRECRQREDGENSHPKRKRRGVQEFDDPDPLIDRREHHGQRGQQRPDLTVCDP